MKSVLLTLSAFGLIAVLALPVLAQTTAPATDAAAAPAADAPAADAPATPDPNALSMGQDVSGEGSTYTRESFEQWQLNCVKVPEGQQEPCQLYQLLKDAKGTAVAEISIVALEAGQQAVAGATVVTPLETLLTEQLTITVDTGKAKRYPFTFCAAIGCISRVGLTAEEVAGFKKGAKATVSIVPVAAPDKTVSVDISLKGFTAGFDAVTAANAAKPASPAP